MARTAGAGVGFGFSGANTYGYWPSSVGRGYGILSGGCVTGSGNCSPRGWPKLGWGVHVNLRIAGEAPSSELTHQENHKIK